MVKYKFRSKCPCGEEIEKTIGIPLSCEKSLFDSFVNVLFKCENCGKSQFEVIERNEIDG